MKRAMRIITFPLLGLARVALPVLAAAAMLLSPALSAGAEVSLPCGWQTGQRVTYHVDRLRRIERGGRTSEDRGAYDLHLTIESRDASGYVLRWRQDLPALSGDGGRSTPEAEALLRSVDGLELVIRTDNTLSPQQLVNETEVRDALRTAIDRLLAMGGNPPEAQAAVRQIFESPDLLPQLMLRDAQLLFLVTCAVLTEGQPVEFEDRLPNPLGGLPLPSRGTVRLADGSPGASSAVVTFEQRLDPAGLDRFLADLKRRIEAGGQELPPGDFPRFEINDTARTEISLADGWPARLDWQRESRAAGTVRLDRLTAIRQGS